MGVPEGWERAFVALAAHLHFQPSELWEMDREELNFWMKQWSEWKNGR